jgi:ribosomal protein S13
MRSPFFFSFLRNWVILLNKLYYNYNKIEDLRRYIGGNHNLYSSSFFSFVKSIVNGKFVHFRRKFKFYPLNQQLYFRSKLHGGFRDLGKPSYNTVLRFRKKKRRSVFKKRAGRYKGRIKFLRKRFKKLTYKGSTRFNFPQYKFFDNRFLMLKKSFYFFVLNNKLQRSRKLFIKFFRDNIIRSLNRRIFHIHRLNKLRKNLINNFRDLFTNRRFLAKLQRLQIRSNLINFHHVFLVLVKLYLQYRVRHFLIWINSVLPKAVHRASSFSLPGFSNNKAVQNVYGVDYKLETISAFLDLNLVAGKGNQDKFMFKKSFFYFFKDPHKKIKKRFFIKIKKIKKRFFKQIWKNKTFTSVSGGENEKIGGILPLNKNIQRKVFAFSRYFLRKRDFFNSVSKKRSKITFPGFTFFGQKFTGKKNDLKVLTLIRSIYRVGVYRLHQILLKFRRNHNMRLFNLRGRFRVNLEVFLRTLILSESFKRLEDDNFNKKLTVRSYHSMRFRLNLPIRGQRTHSNAGTPKRLRKHNPVKRF